MDNIQFDKLKKKVERIKVKYALLSKIEDYEFKIIEYERTIDQIKSELDKAKSQLESYNKIDDEVN